MNLVERLNKEQRGVFDALETKEAQRLFLADYIKGDFEALVWILGYRDLGDFHGDEIKALGKVRFVGGAYRKIWLWSRGFFKTSIITISHSIYLILNNVDIRILLDSYTISIAEDILKSIKNHFIGNEDFRYFFREYCPIANSAGKIEFGTSQEFTIPNRVNLTYKEPTIMASGVGTNLAGLHFDWHKHDDLVTRFSVTNDTQILESKDHYYSLRSLFDNPAVPREDVVGTIYHFNDLYCELRKTTALQESYNPVDVDGVATFPERINSVQMGELLAAIGPYEYQTQYKLNPINPKDAKFKQDWLKDYEETPAGCSQYICVDPASTTKKKSDYTVIERWAVDEKGKQYLVEGIRDKLTAFERINILFEFVSRAQRLKWVWYEVLGGRHGDLEIINQKQQETGKFFVVKETKGSVASKVDRIEQRLVGAYHRGDVLLPKTAFFKSLYDGKVYDFVQLLKLEYLQFPFTEHDDILDCQAQMFEEQMVRGDVVKPVVKQEGLTANDWDRMYNELDGVRKKYPGMDNEQVRAMLAANRLRGLARMVR